LDISHKQTEKLKYELGLKYVLDDGGEYNFLDTSNLRFFLVPRPNEFYGRFYLDRRLYSIYTSKVVFYIYIC